MDRFTVRTDALRVMAAHLDEAGERVRAVPAAVTGAPRGGLGVAVADDEAGQLVARWARAAEVLDDLSTGAADRLLRCAHAYETADADTLRSLGLR